MASNTLDATQALKGILGIGSSASIVKNPNDNSSAQKHDAGSMSNIGTEKKTPPPKGKKNQNSNKKKKQKDKKVENEQRSTKNKNKSQHQAQHHNTSNKKGKKKTPQQTQKQQNTKEENFAWSAFQSPPDASTLPLPAFEKSFSFEEKAKVSESVLEERKDVNVDKSVLSNNISSTMSPKNKIKNSTCSTKKTTNNDLSMEKQTENEIKAILNIPQNQETDHVSTSGEEKVVEQSDSSVRRADSSVTEKHDSKGVNLASLTISSSSEGQPGNSMNKKSQREIRKQQNSIDSSDPIAMLTQYGTANPTLNNPHQNYGMYPSQQSNLYYPMNAQLHQVNPPYLTIQVQVPNVLMPGRRMIVQSPWTGGYPVPIVVPEGVLPGMVIPVSIPNPASNRGSAVLHH